MSSSAIRAGRAFVEIFTEEMGSQMREMEFHPVAEIFELMDEDSFRDLVADIKANGLREEIWLCEGKIIDGRNRYRACREAGVAPRFRDYNEADPVLFVASLNLHRRHLTPGQRAMAAAKAREFYDQQAKERQSATLKKGTQKPVMENFPQREHVTARDQVGKVFGVSGRSVDYATRVLANAVPEVVTAVAQGRMAVSTAAILSGEPEGAQREEVMKPIRSRPYSSLAKPMESETEHDADVEQNSEISAKGVGVIRAHEAVNSLSRIPKNDALRKRGFQIVTDWIKRNK